MSLKKCAVCLSVLLFACNVVGVGGATTNPASIGKNTQPLAGVSEATEIPVIAAEELKTRVEKGEAITIIDVRSTNSYVESRDRIKGAIHVKVRRLRSRLNFAPLKDVPRSREVVTYCSCPADEASIEAAKILMDAGFKRVRVLKGGWRVWLKANGPIEPRSGT
jgi:rhodanese-related sulfurtransferase